MLENVKRKYFNSDSSFNSFSVGVVFGSFCITLVVCFALLVAMVHAETQIQGMPAFVYNSGGGVNTGYMSTTNFKMLHCANGMISFYSTESFSYYGDVSASGGVNTAGASSATLGTFKDADGNDIQLYYIPNLIWFSDLKRCDNYMFSASNSAEMVSSFSDSSYNGYADNFANIYSTNNSINNYFDVRFTGYSRNGSTLTITPTEEFNQSGLSTDNYHLSLKVYSYGVITPAKSMNPYKLSSTWYNRCFDAKTRSLLTSAKSEQVLTKNANICVLSSAIPSRVVLYENMASRISPSPLVVAGGQTLVCSQPAEMSSTSAKTEYTIPFDDSVLVSDIPCEDVQGKNKDGVTRDFAVAVEVKISYRDASGNFQSSPYYCYAINPSYKFVGVEPVEHNNNAVSNTVTSDDGEVTITSTDSFVNPSDVTNLSSLNTDNFTDYIKNGLGFSGNNGFLVVLQDAVGFLPNEVWTLIYAALALSLTIMVIKVVRGM